MPGFSVKSGQGFRGLETEVRLLQKVVKDPRPTLNSVVYPYMRDHVEQMLKTSGGHAGQRWDFSGEPLYARRKASLLGSRLGSMPLLWDPKDALLLPSLINPRAAYSIFRLEPKRLVIGSSLPYAEDLLINGGTGPFGESFPARNPFHLTPAQQQELGDEIEHDLSLRLKGYWKTPTLL